MATEVSEMLDRARETMNRALITLDTCAGRAEEQLLRPANGRKPRKYDDKLASHLAWLTSRVAEVTSALRQLEKHDRVMSKTPAQRFALVCAYLETEASPIQRAEVAGLLARLDQGRSVLS